LTANILNKCAIGYKLPVHPLLASQLCGVIQTEEIVTGVQQGGNTPYREGTYFHSATLGNHLKNFICNLQILKQSISESFIRCILIKIYMWNIKSFLSLSSKIVHSSYLKHSVRKSRHHLPEKESNISLELAGPLRLEAEALRDALYNICPFFRLCSEKV